jgi:endonuclease G, mitochondrial
LDISFLETEDSNNVIVECLDDYDYTPNKLVAIIGYPSERISDAELHAFIEGESMDEKNFSPGFLRSSVADTFKHDCSTLRGNSGSVIVDLTTGKAIGLHFGARSSMNKAYTIKALKALYNNVIRDK